MSITLPSLATRHADLTQRVILEAAVQLLETEPLGELSVRAVAKQAGISERTVFRYFAARDDLLDAVAKEIYRRLDMPPDPTTVAELLAYPAGIYARFEATAALTTATLQSELYHRVRSSDAHQRGIAIHALVDQIAPKRPAEERMLVAANIHYHLIASTWHYYRAYFGFSPEQSVQCARLAIVQALKGLGVRDSSLDQAGD